MLNHFAKVLEKHPLLVIEHIIYSVMIAIGCWGLSPENGSLVTERLVNEFGVYFTVAVYALYLLAGAAGYLSVVTARIEHRINTVRLAFLVFSLAGITNLAVLYAGGHFHPMTLLLNVMGLLVAGIVFLHLKIRQRWEAVGRFRADRR